MRISDWSSDVCSSDLHVDRAAAYEARRHRDQPVEVETLSARPLDQLRDADAATWVDRELASQSPLPIRDAGFGRDVRAAMAGRQQWLVEQQLADADGDRVRLRAKDRKSTRLNSSH